jgi:glycosyltransferase involved in cell wall biosynthesis
LALKDGKDVVIRSSPEAFAQAIVQLLRDAALRQSLGTTARATFVRDFSIASAEATLRRESVLARQAGSLGLYEPH